MITLGNECNDDDDYSEVVPPAPTTKTTPVTSMPGNVTSNDNDDGEEGQKPSAIKGNVIQKVTAATNKDKDGVVICLDCNDVDDAKVLLPPTTNTAPIVCN